MKKILFLFLAIVLFAEPAHATINVENFKSPDIKNDYCGAAIDFRFCKCAFHGDKNYCNQIGKTESSANETVQSGFTAYVGQRKAQFASSCGGDNDILSGNTCTRCSGEHFRYKNACETHVKMCGTEDLHLRFDVKTESCACEPNFEKKESGLCEEVGPVEIKFDWVNDENPPFLADGKNVGVANVSVQSLKEKGQPFVPVKMVLTAGSLGMLKVENEGDNHYRVTYTTPNLIGSDPSKNYHSGINLNFTALNADLKKEEQDKVIPVDLVLYTPIKISAYGFEVKKENAVFKGGLVNSEVNIKSDKNEEEFFSIVGAKIELPVEKIFTTDDKGQTKIPTPNDFLKGKTDDFKFTLVLNEDVEKQLSQSRKKLSDLGVLGENAVVKTFLADFVGNLAKAKNDTERKSLVAGLKRLNYALFFVNKGQVFGKDSAESLATVTKDAAANMIDLLDSVTGMTGEITDKINAKGVKLGEKAVANISKQISAIRKASVLKLGAAMQAGVSYYAPDSKIYLGGLLKFLEDKYVIADNLKEAKASSLEIDKGIKEYFIKQVNSASVVQMKKIESFIVSGNESSFPTLDDSADLEIAKSNYSNLADKYIKAEKGEYWRTMTKSWFDLGFDTVGKGASIVFPEFSVIIGQVENMYKVARSGFVDAPNMFKWYRTHGDIMTQVDNGLKNSLGQKDDTQAQAIESGNSFALIPVAHAESLPDSSQFMDAVADAQIYKSLAEIGTIFAGEFPGEAKEFNVVIDQLKEKSDTASKKAQELQVSASENIPKEDYALWGIPETSLLVEAGNTKIIFFGAAIFVVITVILLLRKRK
ncbi:MAG: hypothetical protein WAW90_01010 [Minisyncoccia bacterium]